MADRLRRCSQPAVYQDATVLQRLSRRLGSYRAGAWVFARVLHHVDRPVSRLTGGRQSLTGLLTGLTVAMLTTTGARSGQPRSVPLLGFDADDGFVVIASNYGQSSHPAWYHNLRADPQALLLVDGVTRAVVAELATGERRERLWATAVALYPGWQVYRSRVPDRDIGVFLLTDA